MATLSNSEDAQAQLNQVDAPISESVCQLCGGDNPIWFVPNEMWNSVVDNRFHFACPSCFIKESDRLGLSPNVWCLHGETDYDNLIKIMFDFGQGKYGDRQSTGLKVALHKITGLTDLQLDKPTIDTLRPSKAQAQQRGLGR
jgi:hypothetical protein